MRRAAAAAPRAPCAGKGRNERTRGFSRGVSLNTALFWGKSTFRDQRKDVSFISFGFISCLTTANLREISVPFRQPGGERANKQWSNGHFAQIGQAGRGHGARVAARPPCVSRFDPCALLPAVQSLVQ